MVRIGFFCTATGAAVIVAYTIANYHLRRKGVAWSRAARRRFQELVKLGQN